jgi:hypothetical protein
MTRDMGLEEVLTAPRSLGQRPKGASWEIITPAHRASLERRVHNLAPQPFQSIFGPTQERDEWRVPL